MSETVGHSPGRLEVRVMSQEAGQDDQCGVSVGVRYEVETLRARLS